MTVIAMMGAVLLAGGVPYLGAVQQATLDSVIVYPNPFDARLSHTAMVFDNLTAAARIRVFKINGELVYDTRVETIDGRNVWGVTNSHGAPLAAGVYVYLVTDDAGHKATGKIAVLK
jgi:hypothetical protein